MFKKSDSRKTEKSANKKVSGFFLKNRARANEHGTCSVWLGKKIERGSVFLTA